MRNGRPVDVEHSGHVTGRAHRERNVRRRRGQPGGVGRRVNVQRVRGLRREPDELGHVRRAAQLAPLKGLADVLDARHGAEDVVGAEQLGAQLVRALRKRLELTPLFARLEVDPFTPRTQSGLVIAKYSSSVPTKAPASTFERMVKMMGSGQLAFNGNLRAQVVRALVGQQVRPKLDCVGVGPERRRQRQRRGQIGVGERDEERVLVRQLGHAGGLAEEPAERRYEALRRGRVVALAGRRDVV